MYKPNPDTAITERGPVLGQYAGKEIPAWIKNGTGRIFDYVGVSGARVNLATLGAGEVVVAPGLIYRDRRFAQ